MKKWTASETLWGAGHEIPQFIFSASKSFIDLAGIQHLRAPREHWNGVNSTTYTLRRGRRRSSISYAISR